ncbi:MAG: hypothetical protein WDN27_04055 [Candidatus Saccharibacteria bacterium]
MIFSLYTNFETTYGPSTVTASAAPMIAMCRSDRSVLIGINPRIAIMG